MNSRVLELVAKLLFLPMLVVSVAFLVKGYSGTGGGFAAGAIAGVAVLLQRLVFGHRATRELIRLRAREASLGTGLALALASAVIPTVWGADVLTHYPEPGAHVVHLGAVELHTSLLFDAGVYLLVFGFVLQAVAIVAPEEEPEG